MLLLAVSLVAFALPALAQTTVSIDSVTVDVDGETTLPIVINNVDDPDGVGTADIKLSFNSDVVHVTASTVGDFDSITPNLGHNESGAASYVTFMAYQVANPGLTSGAIVTTVTLKAVGTAGQESPLDIAITILADNTPAGNDIPAGDVDGTFTIGGAAAANIVINEFMANPSSGGEWVELYNRETTDVDISGWQVDDIEGGSSPTTIPDSTTIAAGGFYVVELSSVLNNGGDTVRLLDDAGTLVDSYTYASSTAGVSEGRITDGADTWTTFDTPTPGASNGEAAPLASITSWTLPATGTRGTAIDATVTIENTGTETLWFVVSVAGASTTGESIVGLGTVELDAGATKDVPVKIPVPGDADAVGTYTLYPDVYTLDGYPDVGTLQATGSGDTIVIS